MESFGPNDPWYSLRKDPIDYAHASAIADQKRMDRDDGASEYFAEMGFTESDRIGWMERHEPFPDTAQAPLPCGCLNHENGGPADYGPECRAQEGR